MCCASRCFCLCRSGRCASSTARDFARAAARTATARLAPAKRVRATPAGKRWLGSAAGSSPEESAPLSITVFFCPGRKAERILRSENDRDRAGTRKELHHAESEKAPLDAPHRQPPRS